MKKILLFWGILLLFLSCHKEPKTYEDEPYVSAITGTVTDALSKEAIKDIPVYILYEAWDIGCPWGYCGLEILDEANTDSLGRFRLAYSVSSAAVNNISINFKTRTIPGGYQYGARINGKYCHTYCKEFMFHDEAILRNGSSYNVELIPNTSAYLVKPSIPAGWEHDTIQLKIENLQEVDFHGALCGANSEFSFRINNPLGWQNIRKPRLLYLGDQIAISYTIRNGVVKKAGTFSKTCAIGEVNAIDLTIW